MKTQKGFMLVSIMLIIVALMAVLGSVSLSVFYNRQFVSHYVDGVKAYYLAVTGVNYIRHRQYNETYYTISPRAWVKECTIELAGSGGTVTVKADQNEMKALITSTAVLGEEKSVILCQSGDPDMSLTMEKGLFGAVGPEDISAQSIAEHFCFYESQMPVTEWELTGKQ